MTSDGDLSQNGDPTRKLYGASLTRKIILVVCFLCLLPFLALLGVMVVTHGQEGHWPQFALLIILFLIYAGALVLLALHILSQLFTNIELKAQDAKFVLPKWRGPYPLLPFETIDLTYDNIKDIEARNEIFQILGLPILMRVTSFVTRDGKRYILGYNKEGGADPAFPFIDISHEIGTRSGRAVASRGTIKVAQIFHGLFKPLPDWQVLPLNYQDVISMKRWTKYSWWMASSVVTFAFLLLIIWHGHA